MLDNSNCKNIELIRVIVNFGLGSKVIQKAKQEGIFGGTVFLCKGTVNNKVLNFFGLTDVRKEMVLMAGETDKVYKALEKLDKEFKFEKPNHGIAFTTSISNILGTRSCKIRKSEERGVDNIMYQAITVIVDKGKAEDVIDAGSSINYIFRLTFIYNYRYSLIHNIIYTSFFNIINFTTSCS